MKSYEMVETLSDKAKVTLAEAKEALEKTNWDMLDAVIYLDEHKNERAQQARNSDTNVPHLNSLQKEQSGEFDNQNFANAPQVNVQNTAQQADPGFSQNGQFGGKPHNGSFQYGNPGFNNQGASVGEMFGRACGNAENAINRGMKSDFIVSRNGRILFQVPLLVFLILTLAFFPTAVTFFIVGLFLDFKYSFGNNTVCNEQFGSFVDKAKSTTVKMKEDFIAGRESTKQ